MSDEVYTLKQVVVVLRRYLGDGDAARIARRVRHWTATDLLRPTGEKHTGTGVSRRYTVDQVRKAAVLVELSRYRVPAPVLSGFGRVLEGNFPGPHWGAEIERDNPVFLFLNFTRGRSEWNIYSGDTPMKFLMRISDAKPDKPLSHPVSAITINLTELFKRLRL